MSEVTPDLKAAIRKAEALPPERQIEVAEAILIAVNEAKPILPGTRLAKMAREAIRQHRSGKTVPLDI